MLHNTPRKHTNSAFTLIELLVVIAIIAILAAILFPVFAQARAAARATSSQSNIRQLALATLMYTQDYDEQYPLFQHWGTGPITVGGKPFSMWSFDVAPYIKNTQVFADPMSGPIAGSSALYPYYTHYGYNYTTLSPYTGAFGATPWNDTPAGLGSINRPAETVMLSSRFTLEDAHNAIYWYGSGTILTVGGSEPPDCSDINAWCFDDWGTGGNYSFLSTEEAGQFTGGNTLRKQLNANFALCDGHCKFMKAGQGAQGTNWYRGISSGNVHITNPNTYMWQAP